MKQQIEIDAVGQFLSERMDGVRDIAALSGGAWSAAYGFTTPAGEYVVRFGPRRSDYEIDALAADWLGDSLPIPAVLEIGDAFDGAFAISERVHGTPIQYDDDELLCSMQEPLLDLAAQIGSFEPPGTGFGGWDLGAGQCGAPSWSAYLVSIVDRDERILVGWREQLRARPVGWEAFQAGCEALVEVASQLGDVPRRLNHMDVVNGNVLAEDSRITGVVDWGCLTVGDPLCEFARLDFFAPWQPGLDPEAVLARAREVGGDDDFDNRFLACQLHVGLDNLQYCAFVGNDEQLIDVARCIEGLLNGAHRSPGLRAPSSGADRPLS